MLNTRKNKSSFDHLTCLSLFQQEMSLVQFAQAEKPILFFHETVHLNQQLNLITALHEWNKKYPLKNSACTWLLSPDEYQLMLIDALNVSEEELIPAIRWRIKDLLNFSLDDAAIDAFSIPPCGQNDQYKKLFVIASRISYLQPTAHLIQKTGLKLNRIDITELNLHYFLNFLTPAEGLATALLVFHPVQTQFIISKNRQLYLARNFNFDLAKEEYQPEKWYENIWLELQRSFDFCESQFGFEAPKYVFIAPTYEDLSTLTEYLNERLAAEVKPILMHQIIESDQPWPSTLPLTFFRAICSGFKTMNLAYDATS